LIICKQWWLENMFRLAWVVGLGASLYRKRGHAASTDESTSGLLGRTSSPEFLSLTILFPLLKVICKFQTQWLDDPSSIRGIYLNPNNYFFFLKKSDLPNQSCNYFSYFNYFFVLKFLWSLRREYTVKAGCHVLKRHELWHFEEVFSLLKLGNE